jgi:hypothetical protein
MAYPLVSSNPETQAYYEWLRKKGNSHKLADMLAFGKAPKARTDREFFAGIGTLEKQFDHDGKMHEGVVKLAMKHGYKPNNNDVYLSSLARFVGDPEAFVSPSGGRGQIQDTCEKRGWECHGTVNTKYREPEEAPKKKAMGNDILARKVMEAHKANPDTKRMDQGELRHDIIEKHRGGK